MQNSSHPNGSGTFTGHVVPAAMFSVFGVFFLVLILKRSRSLPPGTTYCEIHVPERNTNLLWWSGIIVVFLTLCGIALEAGSDVIDGVSYTRHLGHESFYLSYTFVGLVLVLESVGKLPLDSGRKSLCLAFFLQYIGWTEHGLMKTDMADQRIHLLQAQISLWTTIAFGYSIYNPRSIEAYVISFALLILMATWLVTAGLNADFVNISWHLVGPYLSLQALAIASIVTIGSAYFSGSQIDQNNAARSSCKYSTLDTNDDQIT